MKFVFPTIFRRQRAADDTDWYLEIAQLRPVTQNHVTIGSGRAYGSKQSPFDSYTGVVTDFLMPPERPQINVAKH